MPKTVRILGMSTNLGEMPPSPKGVEVWPSNDPRGYRIRHPRVLVTDEWTRWFNLHSRSHMQVTYPAGLDWYKCLDGSRPIYTQKFWSDIPGCTEFPRQLIQETFATSKGPNRYFTCSVCWLVAFAILEGFERIELWGFQLSYRKPNEAYKFERPCFFYWVQEARNRGIEVWYQKEIESLPYEPGDAESYEGTLYGFETKPEEPPIILL